MKRVLFYALILVCGFGSIAEAQDTPVPTTKLSPENQIRTCGSDAYMQQMLQNPVFQQKFLEQQAEIQTKIAQILPACTNPLIVPIAIHYGAGVTTANQQCLIDAAQAQINQLNLDFASCNANVSDLCDWINAGCDNFGGTAGADAMPVDGSCIQFCLGDQNLPAGEDNIGGLAITVGDYTWSGGADAPNWSGYLNIFVDDNAQGNLGIAPLNGAANPNGNGVVILAEAFGAAGFAGCTSGTAIGTNTQYGNGATTTHELGHYFGVDHTFSDNLGDTPPQNNPNFGCPTVNTNDCTSSAGTDFSGNFMDYVDDDCMFTFTEDQVMLMQAVAAAQNSWAINSVSCYNDWQNGTNTYASCQGACAAVCATTATSLYNNTIDICAAMGTYDLPIDYTAGGLALDDNSSATYTWSTGAYLPGGTAITNPYTLVNPAGCMSDAVTIYLNVSCTSDNTLQIDAGTLILNVYPDPTQLTLADLVTVSNEGTCDEPVVTVTTDCAGAVTIVSDAANPTFPVAAGVSGTANYMATYTGVAGAPNCCAVDMGAGELVSNGDFETAGGSPWVETEETPPGTPNPTPFGIIGTSSGPVNSTMDAWFGGFAANSLTSIAQDITISPDCSTVELSYDYITACANNASIAFSIIIGGVTVSTQTCNSTTTTSIGPIDLIALGVPTGTVSMVVQATETANGGQTGASLYLDNVSVVAGDCQVAVACDFPITADYACAAANYDFSITDPCTCNNDGNNITADGTGTFNELVTIGGTTAGETWTVQAVTGANGINAGDALTDNGATFDLMFTHNDGVGYSITVEGPGAPGAAGNVTQTVSNICAYPQIVFTPVLSICAVPAATSFDLTATETTAAADGTFAYAPATIIDPSTYAVGATETFTATYTGVDDGLMGVSTDGVTPAYPACNESVSVQAAFVDCSPACNATLGVWNE